MSVERTTKIEMTEGCANDGCGCLVIILILAAYGGLHLLGLLV